MLAVILIGGKGTRLRPFTLATPKPLLPLLNKPFLKYQLDVLKGHVSEIILCTSASPAPFRREIGDSVHSMRVRYVAESRPLGTGGAVKNAERWLVGRGQFLVLNGDVLNNLDVAGLVKAHRRARAEATIALTRVPDPTLYGLVHSSDENRVRRFVEKPSADEVDVNTINSGAYIFNPSVLSRIPQGPFSLERDLFPALLADEGLYSFESHGYWIDIGTLDRYLQVHLDLLGGRTGLQARGATPSLDGGRVIIGPGSRVDPTARFSGNVCVGARCRVSAGAVLKDCVLLDGTRVGPNARVERCVVGPRCEIGERASLTRATALAGGSRVEAYSAL